ncbi:MAG: ISLre2 family transposase [Fidelibacterota bacterium]
METITLRFPEVKLEISKEGISFEKLEELAFDVSRQIGCKAMEEFLKELDGVLRKERPRSRMNNRGKVFKHILTRLGEVNYSRTRYKDKATGEIRYLADEVLGLIRDQRISLSRQKLEAHAVSETTYRKSREGIKRITGSSRSHEAMRQSVVKEAEKIIDFQKKSFEKIKSLEYETAREAPEIVYNEADGTVIRLQKRKKGKITGKKKKKKHAEVKLGIGYTAREARYRSGEGKGKRLVRKFVYVSMRSRKRFMEEFSLMAEKRLNLSGAKKILFGGDGDTWIKTGMRRFFPGAKYLLCRFHLQRSITTGLSGKKDKCFEVKKLVREDKIDEALECIEAAAKKTKVAKEREAIEDLYAYIRNNRDGILAANNLEGDEEKTGAIEPNIDKVIAHRFKKRGMSWSKKGAISLLKIKETILNGDWNNWWQEDRDKTITIKREWNNPLPATQFKRAAEQKPWLDTSIPVLEGADQDKPWAGVLRKLIRSRYSA